LKKFLLAILVTFCFSTVAYANNAKPPKNAKTKFYDFSEMLIDGEIKKPTALYTDVRQRAKFGRLLSLKKSFLPKLFESSRENVFK